jgi:hypothetical protein
VARKRSHPLPSSTDAPGAAGPAERWTAVTRIVFRFSVIYFGLFVLATQISGSMFPNLGVDYRGLGGLWPMRAITAWTGTALLRLTSGLGEGSRGEPLFFWVQTLWILAAAVIGTIVWWRLDRRRAGYPTLHAWFRLFVRFALAASLFEYGLTKVIPTQFPAPALTTLVTPAGDLTLSALLWTTIGASRPYQILTGCVETLAAILLVVPRTTTLGAVIGLGAALHVFALNMTFDIGLKAISFHLILLALLLLAPNLSRLADLFVRDRPTALSREPALARTRRGARLALLAQLAFGAYLLGTYTYINASFWQVAGGGAPRSALYGIWNVEQLAIDGNVRPAAESDYDRRWRRVIFDEPGAVTFQRTDDSLARYGATIDPAARTLALSKGTSGSWTATFHVDRLSDDRLVLRGEMDGYRLDAHLHRVDMDTFRLLNSTFRWVRPHESRTGPR